MLLFHHQKFFFDVIFTKIQFSMIFGKENHYLGEGTFVFKFYVVNLPYSKFGPHPGVSYGGRGGLSFLVGGKGG